MCVCVQVCEALSTRHRQTIMRQPTKGVALCGDRNGWEPRMNQRRDASAGPWGRDRLGAGGQRGGSLRVVLAGGSGGGYVAVRSAGRGAHRHHATNGSCSVGRHEEGRPGC